MHAVLTQLLLAHDLGHVEQMRGDHYGDMMQINGESVV